MRGAIGAARISIEAAKPAYEEQSGRSPGYCQKGGRSLL